ncbi:MAG: hypothetical protein JSW51_05960 [Gemmatimonadota bacterium]|nr:MAG: hypothetical protein JSW51_05960 [Gemmatimonadota bacterium]
MTEVTMLQRHHRYSVSVGLRYSTSTSCGRSGHDRYAYMFSLSHLSALESEAARDLSAVQPEASEPDVSGRLKRDIADAVLVLMRAAVHEGDDAGDSGRHSFQSAVDRLLVAVSLGREGGLSRLDIQSAITDAARGEATTQKVRSALYDAIKSIEPGVD